MSLRFKGALYSHSVVSDLSKKSPKLAFRTFLVFLAFVTFLWAWHAGKIWLTGLSKELTRRSRRQVVTVIPSLAIVVERLQALNRLETARFISQHIIEVSSQPEWLPSFLAGERLLLMAQVEVIAGVDMSEVSAEDICVHSDEVVINLPQPQIFSIRLDEANTRIFARQRGWLVFNLNEDLEREARLQALSEAKEASIKNNLLSLARRKAEENLRGFLHALGFKRVEIRWRAHDVAKGGELGNG